MSNYNDNDVDILPDTSDTIIESTNDINNENKEFMQNNLLNNLSIQITAQAGQVMLSIQQLMALSLDQVIDIAPLPPKVALLANGVNIGDGYLVELNGRLGVKISRLNSNQSHEPD